MLQITCLTRDFEGEPLPFFTYRGQLATVLKQLGKRLSYARDGERLVNNVMDDWSSEFEEGKHWVRLDGDDLAAFKVMYVLHTAGVSSNTPQLIVLLEPGIHLVLLKTSKPVGVRLRNFLATEVMPALLRTGKYAATPKAAAPTPAPQLSLILLTPPPALSPAMELRAARERRLAAQHELRRRKFASETLRETTRTLLRHSQITQAMFLAYDVVATEIALGRALPDLRPAAEERWYSVLQLAEVTAMPIAAVRDAIAELRLELAPGLSRKLMTGEIRNDRLVTVVVYNDIALCRILRLLTGEQPPKAA